jgi:glycosyltransferase involved in cell wall biosynthesis
VNNNSTDNTISKVREWKQSHPKFSLSIAEEKKPGAPAARNNPLALVNTKWVQFLDADDILLANKISDQMRSFPDDDVICGGAIHLNIDGLKHPSTPEPNIPLALIDGRAGITSSNLFSTTALKNVQGWNESLKSSQEYDLMLRIWKSGASFATDIKPRALICARPSGQISQRNPTEKWRQFIDLRIEMLASFLMEGILDHNTIKIIHQSIFDNLRVLVQYDHKEALNIFNRELKPSKFIPIKNACNSNSYVILFKLFGFSGVEHIKRIASKLSL